MRNLRSLSLAIIGLLAVPAVAFGAETKRIGESENVTEAMFVIIGLITLVLGIAVWFESRKEY
jgi:hypothetical protein